MAYSKELRERAIAQLLPPINASLSAVSQELNIPYQTRYAWRTQSSKQQVPVSQAGEAEDLIDAQTKFTVVLEAATLSGVNLAG